MALGRCDSCKTRLRFGSRTCAHCGAKKKRLKYLIIAVILGEVAAIIVHLEMPRDMVVRSADDSRAVPPPVADKSAPAGWLYFQTRDDMIGDVTRHARVLSLSNLAEGTARDHGSTGVLELRASPAYGRSVIITLKRAAFDTVSENCELRARFDSGEVAVFQVAGSADEANATLVVTDKQAFTDRLRSARTLELDAVLSKTTERTAQFDVAGLRWN